MTESLMLNPNLEALLRRIMEATEKCARLLGELSARSPAPPLSPSTIRGSDLPLAAERHATGNDQ